MNTFESKPSQPKLEADEGWVVQIYGRNRRLLCVLDPAHGWSFLTGCCVGLLLSAIWINVARHRPAIEVTSPTETPVLQID
jgi:hypothetical protein